MSSRATAESRLARRLTTFDAVVIGLGSMIGAGVFAAVGPAARAAGGGLLVGLAFAAVVAYCNATSSAGGALPDLGWQRAAEDPLRTELAGKVATSGAGLGLLSSSRSRASRRLDRGERAGPTRG